MRKARRLHRRQRRQPRRSHQWVPHGRTAPRAAAAAVSWPAYRRAACPSAAAVARIRALTAAAAAPARACAAFTATALACHDNTAPDGAPAADN